MRAIITFFIWGLTFLILEAQVPCTCVEPDNDKPGGDLIICENFDNFQAGGIVPQSSRWKLWSTGSGDATVRTTTGLPGKQLLVEGSSDVLFLLGNRTSGRYRLSWKMFVGKDKPAFYEIQHNQEGGNQANVAFSVFFRPNGAGLLQLGNQTGTNQYAAGFSYRNGDWNKVMHIVDLDKNLAELWINDEFVYSWKFSLGSRGEVKQLGAATFFARKIDNIVSSYLLDNICLWRRPDPCIAITIYDPVCVKNGATYGNAAVAKCDLYTSVERVAGICPGVCDYGGAFLGIDAGETVSTLDDRDIAPYSLAQEPCVREYFGNVSPGSLYGEIYVFKITGDFPVINWNIPAGKKGRVFVFTCDCGFGPGCSQFCQKEIAFGEPTGAYSGGVVYNWEPGLYYVVFLSTEKIQYSLLASNCNDFPPFLEGLNPNISVQPRAPSEEGCGTCLVTTPPALACGVPVTANLAGNVNDFGLGSDQREDFYDNFYTGTRSYAGEDIVYKFTVDVPTAATVTLTHPSSGLGVFLYDYICGVNNLAYAETPANGGTATIGPLTLAAGEYYLVVDKAAPGTTGNYSLLLDCTDDQNPLFQFDLTECPTTDQLVHEVKIKGAANILLDDRPLSTDDKINFLYRKTESGPLVLENARYWNNQEIGFKFFGDAPGDLLKCGYAEGDPFLIKITREEVNYNVQGIYQPLAEPSVTATDKFKNGGKSLITGFTSTGTPTNLRVSNSFREVVPTASTHEILIASNISWKILRSGSQPSPWLQVTPISGRGTGVLTITVNANPFSLTRRDTLLVVGEGNELRRIIFAQKGCTQATVEAGDDKAVCRGASATLTATGNAPFLWSTGQATASITVAPAETTTYSVSVTRAGCTAIDNVTVQVKPLPAANAGPDATICSGQSAELTASGGSAYAWSTNQTGATIIVQPTVTTTYTVTVTNNGCTATDQVQVNVRPPLVANAGADVAVCPGQSASLTATGGGTYAWSTGQSGATISVQPTATTTYTVSVTNNDCTATDQVTVTVKQVSANAGPDVAVCAGQSTSLGATGGGTYAWSTGQTGAAISVQPAVTTIYTVTVTNNGCTATDEVQVEVKPLPPANAGADVSVCAGQNAELTATGGGAYAWSTGQAGPTITVQPAATTTYTVTVTNNGCSATDQAQVAIHPLPAANAGPDLTVCGGQSASLTATGGGTYAWSTGQTAATISVQPTVTTTYTVTVTNNGCTATDQVQVTVKSAPAANAGADQTVCAGQSALLIASGGTAFSWSTGQSGSSINVQPTETTTYTVTVTSGGCTATDEVRVTVKPLPPANAGPDVALCAGQSAELTATGGGTYAWNTGQTSASIMVQPSVSTTFTVTVTDGGCKATDQVQVEVKPLPVANAGPDVSVCAGQPASLTASGGSAYAWSTGQSGAAINVQPAATTTYTVTVTNNGCSATDQVQVTVKPLPSANAGADVAVCAGQSAQLTATGGGAYAWSTGQTGASISVQPAAATTFTVTVTNNGCSATDQVEVAVKPLPLANAGADQGICTGQSAALTATGGSSYVWSTGQVGASISVKPGVTSTYTVTVTENGCKASDQVQVTVSSIPSANAGTDVTICAGQSTSLTATGGGTYAWSTGQTGTTISVQPTATTTYTVTVTNNGCPATDQVQVTVKPLPTANAGADVSVCAGQSASLTATGGGTYAWSTGQTGASISVQPSTTTTYTVTVTNNGCPASDQVQVQVKPLPAANAGADVSVCAGQSASLTATGGGTYAWSTGQTGASISVQPSTTTTYTVTVTNNGCPATDQVQVTVKPLPAANAGADVSVCAGQSASLTATGGGAYAWSTGQTGASISVQPTTTSTFTVTVTTNGCMATDQVQVTVKPLPAANAGVDVALCTGGQATLTASGGESYRWNTGQTTPAITVMPVATTTYRVTVTLNGCSAADEVAVEVKPQLTANAGPDISVCAGEAAVLTATGGANYLWSTGEQTASIRVSPTATTNYSVTVSSNGCTASDQVQVQVKPLPAANAGADVSVCAGQSASLTATGGGAYAWSTGQTGASISVQPSTTTTYTVTVTNNGCPASDQVQVQVKPLPAANAGADVSVCAGQSASLTATGGGTYAWSTGQTGASISVQPSTTTTYTVTVTNNGCPASDQVQVQVKPLPTANAGADVSVCAGQSASLTATGGGTYAWSTGQTGASISVQPSTTTTYTVTVTNNGCPATDQVQVTVKPLPAANAGADVSVCAGQSASLTATGGGAYAWSTGQTGASISVQPTTTSTFTVTVTTNGCTATDQVQVTVKPLPAANAGVDVALCTGGQATLTASGGESYRWNTGQTTPAITVMPVATTTYRVTVTLNGCSAADEAVVEVKPQLTANAGPDISVCAGEAAVLTATGGANYLWSTGEQTASIRVSPTATTNYSVTVSSNGCTASDQVQVQVKPLPAANAGADVSVCAGQSASLTATGGGAYAWSTGQTGASISVQPSTTTTYTVTVTNNGCPASDQVQVQVKPLPAANAGADVSVCAGQSASLTATGGGTYAWSTGQTGASISVQPSTTTTYTVTVTNNGCPASDQVQVQVKPLPAANAGADVSVCAGQSASLTATGGGTYAWSTGQTGASISVQPSTTTTYTVTVTNNGCPATDQVQVTVKPLPAANAGADVSVCAGQSASLTATGGGAYAWSTGQTGASISVQPTTTSTFTVTVTTNGCTATDQVQVTVKPLPAANAGVDVALCTGGQATLTASGGESYRWNTGQTTPAITVMPVATTTYRVTVTLNGCSAADEVVVEVKPQLTANAGPDISVCAGEAAVLTATGGANYLWSTGEQTASIRVSPTATTNYSVTVSSNGCTASDQVQVQVKPLPAANAGADVSVCAGQSASLTATGGGAYAWSTGQTGASISVQPSTTTTYMVTVTNNGCPASDQVQVQVKPLPAANAGADVSVCAGQSASLTATGGGTYAWSTGQTGPTISVQPTANTIFTVTVTSEGCTATDQVQVQVNPIPVLGVDSIRAACFGESPGEAVAGALGGSMPYTFQWSNGTNGSRLEFLEAGKYTVTVTDARGCSSQQSVDLPASLPILLDLVAVLPETDAGADGSIDVSVRGGRPPYLFRWLSGDGVVAVSEDALHLAMGAYSLEITDANGCQLTVGPFMVEKLTGVTDPKLEQYLRVFPNPTNGKLSLRLTLPAREDVQFTLFDALGRMVWSGREDAVQNTQRELDLSAYADGLFLLRLSAGRGMITRTIVLNK